MTFTHRFFSLLFLSFSLQPFTPHISSSLCTYLSVFSPSLSPYPLLSDNFFFFLFIIYCTNKRSATLLKKYTVEEEEKEEEAECNRRERAAAAAAEVS